MIKRAGYVIDTTLSLIDNEVTSFPVDLFGIAENNFIELRPLSAMTDDGWAEQTAFDFWGNDDGAASVFKTPNGYVRLIGYNDRKPPRRVRFTLAHEIMHIILLHSYDRRFLFGDERYSQAAYDEYEAEAHLAAGLLLCHPKAVYNLRNSFNEKALMRVFGISWECAIQVLNNLYEYDALIHASPVYKRMKMPKFDTDLLLPDDRLIRRWADIWPTASEEELL